MNPAAAGGTRRPRRPRARRSASWCMNLGGPDSLDDVEPFLRRLFGDPDVIQLGWLSFLQPLLARTIAKRRGPTVARRLRSRSADARRSATRRPRRPRRSPRSSRAAARASSRSSRWRPGTRSPTRRWRALAAAGIDRAVALPLYPHESRATTGSSLNQLEHARARQAGERDRDRRDQALPGRRRLPARGRRARRGGDRHPARRAPARPRRCCSRPTGCPRRTSSAAIRTSTTSASPSRR